MKRRLVVNARFLTQPTSGVQRFAIEISKRLKKEIPEIQFIAPKNIFHQDMAEELQVIKIGKTTSHLWEQVDLPLYLRKNGNPLLINFTNTGPLFYSKNIIAIHDLAVWDYPDSYSGIFKAFYKFLLPRIAKKALRVVTVSDFSRERIQEQFGVDANVIHNAVSESFKIKSETTREKFILAVSSLDPKKNFSNLLKAFQKSGLSEYSLVIVGAKNSLFKDPGLFETIENNERIKFTGYITDQELQKLYSTATLFVYPSFYEGFGIPPLEAMSSGCPTLVSIIPTLKEVCADAALFADPNSVEDIADKMRLICTNTHIQEELSIKGRVQSAKYSWESSVFELHALLRNILEPN